MKPVLALMTGMLLATAAAQGAEFIILETPPGDAPGDAARQASQRAATYARPEAGPDANITPWGGEDNAGASARKARESRDGQVGIEPETALILQTDEVRDIPVLVMPAAMQKQEYLRRKASAYAAPPPAPGQQQPACRNVGNTVGEIGGGVSQTGVSTHQQGVSAVGGPNCE